MADPNVTSLSVPIFKKPSAPMSVLGIVNNLLQQTLAVPFKQTEWPNPVRRPKSSDFSFVQARPSYYQSVEPMPFSQSDWPVPMMKLLARNIAKTHINSNLTNTLAPVVLSGDPYIITWGIGTPAGIAQWELLGLEPNPMSFTQMLDMPPQRKRPIQGYIQTRPLFSVDEFPMGDQSHDVPVLRRKTQNVGFVQSRPSFFQEPTGVPFKQVDWITPRRKPYIITTMNTRPGVGPVIGNPFRQLDWPNPLPVKRLRPGWIDYFIMDSNNPPINSSIVLPLRKKISAITWITTGLVASPIVNIPVGVESIDLPVRRLPRIDGWITPSLSVTDVPFMQDDWPNPAVNLVNRNFNRTWIQSKPSSLDEIPISEFIGPERFPAKTVAITHLSFKQLDDTLALPIIATDFTSLPQPRKQQPITHIVNLLQSTLAPAPTAAPFVPVIFDNPQYKKRNDVTWIQSLPQYYVDVLPFSQEDWPVYRRYPRPLTDWIWSRITEPEKPFVAAITDIPVVRRKSTEGWIVSLSNTTLGPLPQTSFTQKDWPNPLRGRRNQVGYNYSTVLLFESGAPFKPVIYPTPGRLPRGFGFVDFRALALVPDAGLKPFNQNDWPNPQIKRTNYQILSILGQDFIILPSILGREICLLSSITEYYLISSAPDFDLESSITEYNLDSGGSECQ